MNKHQYLNWRKKKIRCLNGKILSVQKNSSRGRKKFLTLFFIGKIENSILIQIKVTEKSLIGTSSKPKIGPPCWLLLDLLWTIYPEPQLISLTSWRLIFWPKFSFFQVNFQGYISSLVELLWRELRISSVVSSEVKQQVLNNWERKLQQS